MKVYVTFDENVGPLDVCASLEVAQRSCPEPPHGTKWREANDHMWTNDRKGQYYAWIEAFEVKET